MLESFWVQFVSFLEKNIAPSQPLLFSFLKQIKPVQLLEKKLILGCDNPGLKIFLEKKTPVLEDLLLKHVKKPYTISFVLLSDQKKDSKKKQNISPLLKYQPSLADIITQSGLSLRYCFENFAVSSTNQVAYAAAQAVVNSLGTAYNPLFLYGGVGVGKTHLAQSVGRKILEKDSKKKVFFSPGDLFTNELIESIREKKTNGFRRKYRSLNLLIIDDVQFIAGKQAVQEEFFHTFNSIIDHGGQIILTSDQPPTTIKNLEDRLRSRFSGGLIIDIQPPDFELRTAIVLIKSQEKNIKIDIEAAKIIAERISDSRALEGALVSIYAKTLGKKEQIDSEEALLFFNDKSRERIKKISPNDVVEAVSSYYNIRKSKIKGVDKEGFVVVPRQITMFLLRKHLGLKLEQIAFFLNKKDHTTVIHGIKKIERLLIKDPLLKQEVEKIVSSLGL